MNIPETEKVIAILVGGNVLHNVTEMTIEVWADALSDLAYPDVALAARQWVQERDKWVTPAGIRQLVVQRVLGLPASAGEAWERVLAMLRERQTTIALDPATKTALASIGGYGQIVRADDLTWWRKEFMAAWGPAMVTVSKPDMLKQLTEIPVGLQVALALAAETINLRAEQRRKADTSARRRNGQ